METLIQFYTRSPIRFWIGVAVLCALWFLPFQSAVPLFDWDEVNFAELAREMVVTGHYLQPQFEYRPFTEKPPLFFWLQALSMQCFGTGEFGARFPNALAGFATLIALFYAGKRVQGVGFGLLWMGCYAASTLPHLYFRSGLIDPWFNLFIFLALNELYAHQNRAEGQNAKSLWLGGIALGLAVLTKGPAALLIVGLVVLVIEVFQGFRWLRKPLEPLVFGMACIGVSLLWYGSITLMNGPAFAIEFTLRQWALLTTPDAGHGGFPGYHFVVLLLGCFPASVGAIAALWGQPKPRFRVDKVGYGLWMSALLWVVLILFSLVRSKIVHYSSLAYFPLAYWAAMGVAQMQREGGRIPSGLKALGAAIALIYALASFALVGIGRNPGWLIERIEGDPFARANFEAAVEWPWFALLAGFFALASALVWIFRSKPFWILGLHLLWIQSALYLFPARIERYSQHANVAFFKGLRGEAAHVATYGFKSYVPFYYSERQPADVPQPGVELLTDSLGLPAYFVVKIDKSAEFEAKAPDARRLKAENGFVFYRREPSKTALP